LPRNPGIAAALHDTRFAETKGSGVRVMREMCEQAGLAPPLFESDRANDQFIVRLFFHHFLGPEDLLMACPQQTGRNGERADPRVLIFLGLHTYASSSTVQKRNYLYYNKLAFLKKVLAPPWCVFYSCL